MTTPVGPTIPPPPLAVGVLADVQVRVISIDSVAQTATIRVVDNNLNFITAAVALPQGVVRPTSFAVALWDVLESTAASKNTGVVRWLSADGLMWSESPSGVPARQVVGWRKVDPFPPEPAP